MFHGGQESPTQTQQLHRATERYDAMTYAKLLLPFYATGAKPAMDAA